MNHLMRGGSSGFGGLGVQRWQWEELCRVIDTEESMNVFGGSLRLAMSSVQQINILNDDQ